MENMFERLMYASRWIMAPIYLGLSLILLALGVKFFQEILHILPNILEMKEVDLVLVTLSLIDITLVGGLIVMVMFSGYETSSRASMSGMRATNWCGSASSMPAL